MSCGYLYACIYLVRRSLSKLMDDTSDDRCEYLDSALLAMNTSLQNTTKFTPFYMMLLAEICVFHLKQKRRLNQVPQKSYE